MRKLAAAVVVSVAAAATLIVAASELHAAKDDPQDFTKIEHGRYLATLGDCIACHTVPNGGKPFAGGRPIETPFGNLVSPNITPDPETGIGLWSEDDFDNALRHGIRRDGARLYPAMPYPYYTKMSRDDVAAIRAYLRTVEPVKNFVVANQLPFPFSLRFGMRLWDAAFFKDGEYKPDETKSAEWNRGAFLVRGPGHCGACHTPKTFAGSDKDSQALQGGRLQDWVAPNITNSEPRGLGTWSAGDIVTLLKTGHNKLATVTGPMAEVVVDSTSKLTDPDLHAIATYLKDQPGDSATRQPLLAGDPAMKAGEAIYRDVCSACHGLDGKGTAHLFPSLTGAATVRAADPLSAVRVVLRGARSVATDSEPTAPAMPAYDWLFDDGQIAAVLTYIRNSWGNAAEPVAPDDIAKARAKLANRPD